MTDIKNEATVVTVEDFGSEKDITRKDEKGREIRFVLLSDGKIAKVKKGKGKDVENATAIAGNNQKKYFSALMASVVEIDGIGIIIDDLAELDMQDYMRIQVAFSELNF